jgi:hypothetical protein
MNDSEDGIPISPEQLDAWADTGKTPWADSGPPRRLMDMLAGWNTFVHEYPDDAPTADLERDVIAELYQKSGVLAVACDGLTTEAMAEKVHEFVLAEVVPVLLGGFGD